jgi:hypothetical protein
MVKYKICNGLAIMPKKDMKRLKNMSKKGWHLKRMKGIFYVFESGEAKDYDYALNSEIVVEKDLTSFYEASGWRAIILNNGYQIFRAPEGTKPIFTDVESKLEVLQKNKVTFRKWTTIFGVLLVLWLILENIVGLKGFFFPGYIVLVSCFIFVFFPYLGLMNTIRKIK